MAWDINAQSFVLFVGNEKEGVSFPAKLPKPLISMGIDVRYTKKVPSFTVFIETCKAKDTDYCEPDGKWEPAKWESICGPVSNGTYVLKPDDRGGCRINLPCVKGDFIRARIGEFKTDGKADQNTADVLISLAVR